MAQTEALLPLFICWPKKKRSQAAIPAWHVCWGWAAIAGCFEDFSWYIARMKADLNMMDSLEAVADDIRTLILAHPFLEQVTPEYLRQGLTAYTERGGKMLRPALCMWSCGAVGGDPQQARYAAAACEMFHTWTLVHDDIIDEDDTRRGGPSAHRYLEQQAGTLFAGCSAPRAERFGTNMAILVGDVQQAFANVLLCHSQQDGVQPAVLLAILQRLNGLLTPGLIGGEASDVEFEDRALTEVSADDMIAMYRAKTGLLLRFAAETGAQIGLTTCDAEHQQVRTLGRFAETAGLAFQLQDDVLGMYGDEESLGKPIGSDLRRGKRTLLIAAAVERLAGEDLAFLLDCLGDEDLTTTEAERASRLIDDCGALDFVRTRAADLAAEARRELDELAAGPYRELLADWAYFVCQRTW